MSTIDEKLKLANDNVPKVYEAGGAGIDLTNYVQKTDYATASTAGVVKVASTSGIMLEDEEGSICINAATEEEIGSRAGSCKPIVPENLNSAVKVALSDDNRISDMTDTEKANARDVIGAVGKTDYASKDAYGIVQINENFGLKQIVKGMLGTNPATTTQITMRTGDFEPIAPGTLNHAVKAALTDSNRIANMTDTEKANARDVIGAEPKTSISTYTGSVMSIIIPIVYNQLGICDADVTTLSLSVTGNVPVGYECSFTFQSGETATTITYPGDSFKFVGVDCDVDGDFVPSVNTNYEVSIRNLSTNTASPLLVARVGVY